MLEQLSLELIAGEITPSAWAARALTLVEQHPHVGQRPAEGGSGLEGLGAIARVVKRRALRSLLPELPLAELTTLLLVYVDAKRAEALVGLIAETPTEAAALVVQAHRAAQAELDRLIAGKVGP